ncbi:hypothetical protein K474DRAFT_1675777 [Panus rudis PR-1116 ss-1]|nr:hypothetical protein K474DRAFT_1675777 [Panus rudis PR-1116 ss-1]
MATTTQRHPPAQEIIDVDSLDIPESLPSSSRAAQVAQSSSRAGPSNRAGPSSPQDYIVVLDSDDEDSSPLRNQPSVRHARPPPVPPLPHRLNTQSRVLPHPQVIIPNSTPFAFEADLGRGPSRPRSPPPQALPPPRAAARSHHQPSMGFGGALLAIARQDAQENRRRQQQQTAQSRSRSWNLPLPSLGSIVGRAWPRMPELIPGHIDWDNWPFGNTGPGFSQDFDFGHAKESEAMWKPWYTHPNKPQPGFSFDFGGDAETASNSAMPSAAGSGASTPIVILDDEEEAAQVVTPSLVCASCMAPLVLDSGGASASSEEDRKMLRVFGLRCGHMLCGRCMQTLMRPKPPPDTTPLTTESPSKGKGKGKARADVKGKGRAVATAPLDPVQASASDPVPDTSIRSRLRPRNPPPTAPADTAESSSRPTKPLPRRKPKAKGRKSHILEEYEWTCPVPGCGHPHKSIRVSVADNEPGDGWCQDVERGAIALFV